MKVEGSDDSLQGDAGEVIFFQDYQKQLFIKYILNNTRNIYC